jgi:transcriptional regulator of aromatic amino acid metabolism
MLTKYSWPGNYRELACELENSVVSCEGETLGIKCLELCSRMVMENIVSPHAESLLEFKNVIEKNLVNIMYGKTMSEDSVSAALDITKNRVTDNIIK